MARFLFIDIDKEFDIILSEKNREGLRLLKRLRLQRDELQRIKSELNSGLSGIRAPRCYVSLPASMFGFRIIELPFKEEDRIREVLPFELKERIMESLEEIVYDFVKIPSDREKAQKILAVYTKKNELSSLLKSFSEIGIEPDTVGSLSLRSIIEKGVRPEDLLNPPDYEDEIPELIKKETERPVINLLKGSLGLTIERENILKRLKTMNILLISIITVLGIAFGISIKKNYSESSRLRVFINEEYKKEFPQEKIKDEILQLRSHLKEMKDKRDILAGIPAAEILRKIRPPLGIIIESVDIDTRGITIRGESRELSGIEAFREGLKGDFRNPSIIESGQISEKFRFTIKAER